MDVGFCRGPARGRVLPDVVRLSAYLRRHLNVHGHYSFQLPDLAGTRRPLRDPDAGDER